MSEVKIANALVSNYAEVRDSLANVLGAFPEWWTVTSLPIVQPVGMVVVAQLERDELDKRITLRFQVTHPNGKTDDLSTVIFVRGTGAAEVEGPKYQILPVGLNVNFQTPGEHVFTVLGEDGEILATVPLGLRVAPPPSVIITSVDLGG